MLKLKIETILFVITLVTTMYLYQYGNDSHFVTSGNVLGS